ncbi:MAG: serine hydrolase domain-containing protein [Pseudomonadota bacterium]
MDLLRVFYGLSAALVNSEIKRTQRAAILLIVSVFILCLFFVFEAAAQPSLSPDFDEIVEQGRDEWGVPGLFVSIVKDDEVVLAKGYGVRRAGRSEKVDERTLFSIGSTSKAFAAATVAVLVDDGAMGWDDPVRQHMSWFELYDPIITEQFTIRDMLSGTLGASFADENKLRPSSLDSRDILDKGKAIAPRASFRSGFVYSNNMFIASGLLVEEVSGTTWEEFAKERLWDPLGMASTNASDELALASGNAAFGHTGALGSPPEAQPFKYCDDVCVPSGGVNSNAADIARWLRLQLADGTIDNRQIIGSDAFKSMHRPQSIMRPVEDALSVYTPFPNKDLERWGVSSPAYGFGWGMFDYREQRVLWHSGGANNTSSIAILVPGKNLGIFISANRLRTRLPQILALGVLDDYLGGRVEDWAQHFESK